jgi:hypothetical protein
VVNGNKEAETGAPRVSGRGLVQYKLQSADDALETAGTPAHEFADVALNLALRGSSLTHQLLSYAGRQLLRPEVVVLEPFLTEIRTLLARTLGPHIDIRVRTDQGVTV